MKLIIAGGRHLDEELIYTHLMTARNNNEPLIYIATEIVSGGCPTGADRAAECYADSCTLPVKLFKADWNRFGKYAGPHRNRLMAAYADALYCFWDGKSRGTKNMIEEMNNLGKPVKIILCGSGEG